jgi:AraC-like DNA-binding protein
MLSSTTGVFRESDDFEAAMREDGCTGLVVTHRGPFKARLTRISLHRLRLLSVDESAARIAFFSIPADVTLVTIPTGRNRPSIWGGIGTGTREIVTIGAGHRTHSRSAAGSRWGTILLPTKLLETHARTLNGTAHALPSRVTAWRPTAQACRHLIRLHVSATRVATARAGVITTSEAAKSLELDLLEAAVACLSEAHPEPRRPAEARHSDVMARFEDLLAAQPSRAWTVAALSEALDLSGRLFRMCCDEHLGMGPNAYMRVRRMQLARVALRRSDPATASVAQIAALYGFPEPGRFAGAYQASFGELPSVTLRRSFGM